MSHLKQKNSWKTHHCAPCIHWSVILRGQLYSHRSILFYFLSFPQLSSSLQTNIARRTNNLSLAEMSFSLLRPIMFFGIWNNAASLHSCARASPNVIIVATIIYQCQLGWGVSNSWIFKKCLHFQILLSFSNFADNVLWHLEQCCSALLQAHARALMSLLLPPLYTNVNWAREFPTDF